MNSTTHNTCHDYFNSTNVWIKQQQKHTKKIVIWLRKKRKAVEKLKQNKLWPLFVNWVFHHRKCEHFFCKMVKNLSFVLTFLGLYYLFLSWNNMIIYMLMYIVLD